MYFEILLLLEHHFCLEMTVKTKLKPVVKVKGVDIRPRLYM